MRKHFIELRDINKSFYGNKVLDNINLHVDPGEVLCIAGENGSGKSTIIKIISGVYEQNSGELVYDGKTYDRISPSQAITEGIQVIYQDFSVFPNLTVAENIGLSFHLLEQRKLVDWKQCWKIAEAALNDLGVELDLNKKVGELSVAQKQIVAISRAIMQEARLVIMDEPTTTLSYREILRLYEIIERLKKRNISIIFVSHKLDEVFAVSDRIIVIRNGVKVVDKKTKDFDKDNLSFYMTGSHVKEEKFIYRDSGVTPVFEVKDLSSKGYFQDISFRILPGEIFCITGQLGSGRTELAKALFGMHHLTGGSIRLKGKEIVLKGIKSALRNRICYIPEDRLTEGLFLEISIKNNIIASVIKKITGRFGLLNEAGIAELSQQWIEKLSVDAKSVEHNASSLSGGNQQRIVLAKWLAAEPEVLILNCPTVGVDIKSKSEIHKIIKELALNGIAIIIISDDIGEILSNSNRMIIMKKGKISYELETAGLSYSDLSSRITED